MEKFIVILAVLSLLTFGTIKFTSVFKYLGLSVLEAVSISFLTCSFIIASIGKILVTYGGYHPIF